MPNQARSGRAAGPTLPARLGIGLHEVIGWAHRLRANRSDAIRKLFARGEDETSQREVLGPSRIYVNALTTELHLQENHVQIDVDLATALDEFAREVVMAAGWYQSLYLDAKKKAYLYILCNIALVLLIPLGLIWFGKLALQYKVNATASQIAGVLTGLFALQKILSAWYSSQQRYAAWYKASYDLKCLYYNLRDSWSARAPADYAALPADLNTATTTAREIIKCERMEYYTALALPTFDVLNMFSAQSTTVMSWVSGLLPARPGPAGASGQDKGSAGNGAGNAPNGQASGADSPDTGNDAGSDADTGAGDDADTLLDDSPALLPVSLKPGTPVAGTPLTQDIVNECMRGPTLANANDINLQFEGNFINWFNTSIGKDPAFAKCNHIVNNATYQQRFTAFWDQIPLIFGEDSINVLQFIALMCVALAENGGNFSINREVVGTAQYPGLSYAFDKIGTKKSYNTLKGNCTAGQLFRDPAYLQAHSDLPGYQSVMTPPVDSAWNTAVWPVHFNTEVQESINGFVMQADFYKLRGRGVIQTTGRSNYVALLLYLLQNNLAKDTTLVQRLAASGPSGPAGWTLADTKLQTVLTQARGADLDALFSSAEVLAAGVRSHSSTRGYLNLSTNANTLSSTQATATGSFYRVGLAVNGGTPYASVGRQRMLAMAQAYARLHNPDIGVFKPAQLLNA